MGGSSQQQRGASGLQGQVWTCHQAPTAPATRPSLPTQFHLCACLRDSSIQFISLTSANGVRAGGVLLGSGFIAESLHWRELGAWLLLCAMLVSPFLRHACCCWPHWATYRRLSLSRLMEGAGRSKSSWPLSSTMALLLVPRIEKPQWVQVLSGGGS